MHRLIAVFFLFVYLFANTELHELAKMSMFITHFQEHQKENKDITLVEFVKIHYFSGNLIDDDHDKDMQLPFKVTDCFNASSSHIIPLQSFLVLIFSDSLETMGLPPYDQSALPSMHLADIWQPPKAC